MHSKFAARLAHWMLGCALLAATPALATDYLDRNRVITNSPQSTTENFNFTLAGKRRNLFFDLTIEMTQGQVALRILDPAGQQRVSMAAQIYSGTDSPITGAETQGNFGIQFASASLMVLVAMISVWLWRRRGVGWNWFGVGAGLWLVAVIVKFAIAIPLNPLIYQRLKTPLPDWAYLSTGTVYGGVLTGITEVVFVLVAALIWPRMAATADRAVAIGVGAGAFEAALIGLGVCALAITGSLNSGALAGTYTVEVTTTRAVGEWHLRIHDAPKKFESSQNRASSDEWTMALVGPTERVITILCHTASRALVLLAVARRRWALFWAGFALLSGADAVATLFWITGQVKTLSPWLMEGLIAPFGLVSIPITIWCVRLWSEGRPAKDPEKSENNRLHLPGA